MIHIEWTQGVARTYDPGHSFENADPFVSVIKLDKIGPDTVLLSIDLTTRKVTRRDLTKLRTALLQHGFKYAQCWRKTGKVVPFGGRALHVSGNLTLWEVTL